ncbi:MAG TPA: hypothetical protein PLW14_12285 [Chlorobiota bacterium]|nr:hypothetical protein [Chlorobiota bacterium]
MKYLHILLVLFIVSAVAHAGDTIYVNAIAEPGGDGRSWNTAFRYVSDGISVAAAGDELWIARGSYPVDRGEGFTRGDRSSKLVVSKAIQIYGGFAGTESHRELRDWYRKPTIITGDLLLNDPAGAPSDDPAFNDNAHCLLEVRNVDSSCVIDGIMFRGAVGATAPAPFEGCIVIRSLPQFRNCTFEWNAAQDQGIVRFEGVGRVRFEFCVFRQNVGAPAFVARRLPSAPPDSLRGPYIGQCVFTGNVAPYNAAFDIVTTDTINIVHSIVVDNTADSTAIATVGGGTSFVAHCTFFRNRFRRTDDTNDVVLRGATLIIQSSVFWDGEMIIRQIGPVTTNDFDTIESTSNLVEADFVYGTYTFDPIFADPGNPPGPDGFWNTDDDGLRGGPGSVMVDRGLVSHWTNHARCDAIGNPRVVGNRPDLGAYEKEREGHERYREIMDELRDGKLVLLFRHSVTDWGQRDPGPAPECFPGRNLSTDGRDLARRKGEVIRAQNVPVGDVFTSPVCRCWESWLIAFGRYDIKSYWASGGGPTSNDSRRQDLYSIPTNGNRFINTHDAVIVPILGVTTAETIEGDGYILRPNGTDWEIIGHFAGETWERYHVRFPSDTTSSTQSADSQSVSLIANPNPADEWIRLGGPSSGTFTLVDMTGRTVRSGAMSDRIYVADLLRGVYVIRHNESGAAAKIVVQH